MHNKCRYEIKRIEREIFLKGNVHFERGVEALR
jgi:hypothetical protein